MNPKRKARPAAAAPPPAVLHDQVTFDLALAALAALDQSFVATTVADAPLALRRRAPGFAGLTAIITAQQVSTASAAAIFARVEAHFGTLDAAALLAASDTDLRACGLSAPKMRTLRAIATAIDDGTLDLEALTLTEAEAAHQTLIAIKGIGPWTADVFLLFCLGHADAWPAGDLALQEAARLALGLEVRPTTKELIALGERWRPLRGVAAHCLWAYYGTARGRAGTLDAAPKPVKAKPAKMRTAKAKPMKKAAAKTPAKPRKA